MSDVQANQEAQKVPLLVQFMQQRDAFIQQSTQLSTQFQQLQGAIFACNEMIARMEQDAKEQMQALAKEVREGLVNTDNHGENVDGEANSEQTEQPAQE